MLRKNDLLGAIHNKIADFYFKISMKYYINDHKK